MRTWVRSTYAQRTWVRELILKPLSPGFGFKVKGLEFRPHLPGPRASLLPLPFLLLPLPLPLLLLLLLLLPATQGPKPGVLRRRPLTAMLLGMCFWNSVRIDQVIRRAVRDVLLGFGLRVSGRAVRTCIRFKDMYSTSCVCCVAKHHFTYVEYQLF